MFLRYIFLVCLVFSSLTSFAQEATNKSYKEVLLNTKTELQKKAEKQAQTQVKAVEETAKRVEEKIIMKSEELKEVKKEQKKTETFVVMDTEKGTIRIKLFMEEAPITAGNFKDLVERKFYNGLIFHRVIPGFVIQGGCPLGNGTGNFIDPETKKTRYIKHEMPEGLRHNRPGIVAMARTADPNSASSQFFIDLEPLPSLDPGGVDPYGYAIFGEVVEGMDVVEKIAEENVPPYPGSDASANPVKILSASIEEE